MTLDRPIVNRGPPHLSARPRTLHTVAMPDLARRYTVAEVLEFPEDGNRYEVVQGELLVTPSPRRDHQLVIGRLVLQLHNYLDLLGLADLVLTAPADITWGVQAREADELVQPDIFV